MTIDDVLRISQGVALTTLTDPSRETDEPAVDVATERRRLRQHLLAQRQALPKEKWRRLSAAVCAHLRAGFPQLASTCLAFCWPHRQEADLRPLIVEWWQAARPGFCAALPVVVEAGEVLVFRRWTPETPLYADRYGIPTPAEGDFVTPTALLIPLNGFDAAGYRLGYGGGYFDRTLAGWPPPRPLALGVGFEIARLPKFPHAAHDQPLDALITESGVFRLRC